MIKTYTGPMFAGKSTVMMKEYDKIFNKDHILVFKPSLDSRDSGVMTSRTTDEEIPATIINSFDDILDFYNEKIRTIFIDEAEFIKEGNVGILSYLSIVKDVDIYISGLNMTSEQEPFGKMPDLLSISDVVVNVPGSCFDCGRDAYYTYHEGEKNGSILVGNDGYMPLCYRCLRKRRGEEGMKVVLKMGKPSKSTSKYDDLLKLKELLDKRGITIMEYNKEKEKILNRE